MKSAPGGGKEGGDDTESGRSNECKKRGMHVAKGGWMRVLGVVTRKKQSTKTSKKRVAKNAQGSCAVRKAIWTGTTVAV